MPPSLNHVSMWMEKGWKHVTAEDVEKMYPKGNISSRSGLFMCELCGQFVQYQGRTQYVTCYFKHSSHEEDKSCPERTGGTYKSLLKSKAHGLPIKINIRSKQKASCNFALQIGLLPVPEAIWGKTGEFRLCIRSGKASSGVVYSKERLIPQNITYLELEDDPAEKYIIEVKPRNEELERYWPSEVSGIKEIAVFDGKTGKKLPEDADVVAGRSYYVLSRGYMCNENGSSVFCREICVRNSHLITWRLYEVTAKCFDENAAKFFLKIRCRLTANPVTMIPFWPPAVHTPYVIKHDASNMMLYIKGDVETSTFPAKYVERTESGMAAFINVDVSGREQLLSVGRTRVLKYLYFWKEPFRDVPALPEIKVTNFDGRESESGILYDLPPKKTLLFYPVVDGSIIIRENGKIIEKMALDAGKSLSIYDIHYGMEIEAFQGFDSVWMAAFRKKIRTAVDGKAKLLLQLKNAGGNYIEVPHSLAGILEKMDTDVEMKAWL